MDTHAERLPRLTLKAGRRAGYKAGSANVRNWRLTGEHMLVPSISGYDPERRRNSPAKQSLPYLHSAQFPGGAGSLIRGATGPWPNRFRRPCARVFPEHGRFCMNAVLVISLGLACILLPTTGFAHTGPGEASGLVHGFAHPLGGLDH